MSGMKGYPTQKKSLGNITGYTADQTESKSEFVTVQKTVSNRLHQDVVNAGLFRVGAIDATESGSTKRLIIATSHGAKVGDVIRFETGDNIHVEMGVLSIPNANTMILSGELETTPTIGDTFYIMRYVTPKYEANGEIAVSVTQGPIEYVYNGVDTEVEEDTTDQADSRPLPVKVLNTFVPAIYDEVTLTYVTVGNGIGEISTAVYEQGGVTVATLTLSYDANNKLSNVVRS